VKRINTLYDAETTAKFWFLQQCGHRTSIDREKTAEAIDWCDQRIYGLWGWHHKHILIDIELLTRNFKHHFTGEFQQQSVQDLMYERMSENIAEAMDLDILNKLDRRGPNVLQNYFWFSKRQEAILFKLTWC